MNEPGDLDPDIVWYYAKGGERDRLDAACWLEAARTKEIIASRLDESRLSVIDVGAGPGVYACWLAGAGHDVHVVDPVPLHVEQAEARSRELGVALGGTHVGLASRLPFENGRFDVALLLGPLYHLTDRSRRVEALHEARRVLRPGGLLFASAISRYAAAVDGFFAGHVVGEDFTRLMTSAMATGQWRNENRVDGLFTTAYFHRPHELASELVDAGFPNPEILAVEGAWGWIPELAEKWEEEEYRGLLLETLAKLESDPSVVGFGGHLMGVARTAIRG